MGQRSRKRGRRERPPIEGRASPRPARRSAEERNAAVRATLEPFEPGERPWAIRIGAFLAALSGGFQVVLFVFGVKLKVAGTHANAGQTVVFGALMFICAGGMWLMRYWAVLGFMVLLALTLTYFALALLKASSLLGFGIAIGGLAGGGFLFYKLIRTLSRIQLPKYTGR